MGDMDKVVTECREEFPSGNISDAAARVIGALYHEGGMSVSYQFASTGFIADPGVSADERRDAGRALYREMFPRYPVTEEEMVVADMIAAYITRRCRSGDTGPVAGWSGLWL